MDQKNNFSSQNELNPVRRPKIIKRYGNRKLYDTEQSSYVVLSDIAKMIRQKEEVQVIDNETKDDITTATLTQIIFGAEKKSNVSTPLNILKNIIKEGDGSFSHFLSKMGLFNAEDQKKSNNTKSSYYKNSASTEEKKQKVEQSLQTVEQKIATMTTTLEENKKSSQEEKEFIPHLPGSSIS